MKLSRVLWFSTGFLFSILYLLLTPILYGGTGHPLMIIWGVVIWPGSLVRPILESVGGMGWIVLNAIFVGSFWGLIAVAIGWGWEKLTKKEK